MMIAVSLIVFRFGAFETAFHALLLPSSDMINRKYEGVGFGTDRLMSTGVCTTVLTEQLKICLLRKLKCGSRVQRITHDSCRIQTRSYKRDHSSVVIAHPLSAHIH